MESLIKKLIQEAKETYDKINELSLQASKYHTQGKSGYYQSCMVRVRYFTRKLVNIKQQLTSIINGDVAFIKYKVISKTYNLEEEREAILINMTDSDIRTTLEIYCQVNELKLNNILEIKRIPTKLG